MNESGDPILVVDDDPGFRAFVVDVLRAAGFRALPAGSGRAATELAERSRPVAVLLDVRLPDLSGHEICRQLRDRYGEQLPILFVSGVKTDELDEAAGLLLGADDYLVKPIDVTELLARVRRAVARTRPGNRSSHESDNALTRRELEVLGLLSDGLSQDEIARRLVISPKTVATHIQNVLGKLGVHSRTQALALAYRQGLLEPSAMRAS